MPKPIAASLIVSLEEIFFEYLNILSSAFSLAAKLASGLAAVNKPMLPIC
jgi:hypothetical protein